MLHMLTGCLIQQTVFTASGCNMDLALTDHVMKIICIDTRCVDHRPGSDISPVCQKLPSIFQPSDSFDFCVKLKFHPIFTGILCQCQIESKGTHNACRWCIQCCTHFRCQIRLHLMNFFPVQDTQILDPVGNPTVIESLQSRHVFLRKTDYQRPDPLK